MHPVYRLILRALVCLALAAGGYFLATGLMNSLFAYRSPLKDQPPASGARLGQPATRRVVFVLVDALRYDTAQNASLMPTLNWLRQQGASAQMHSQPPSFSEAGYSVLMTGAWPYLSDGPAMNLDYADIPTWTQDNLFSASARAGLKTAVSGYYWFEKLIPQQAVTTRFYTPGEDAQADQDVMKAALPWLSDPQAYQLILIHIDQVDYAGHHQGGPQGAEWAAAAQRTDAMLAEIAAKLDLSQDTIFVCSDHGQIDAGGHGGQDPITLVEPFVLAGAGVKPGIYGSVDMVDVAPTLAALLGINIPASAQGQVLTGLLALPEAVLKTLPAAEQAQQQALVQAYETAIGQPGSLVSANSVAGYQSALEAAQNKRLGQERVWRGVVGLAVFAGLLYLLYRLLGANLGWGLAGILLYGLLFNLRYAVIDRLPYSFSSVKGPTELIIYCAETAALALVVGWLAFALGSRTFRLKPLLAANGTLGLALGLECLLALPLLAHFVLNGLFPLWSLPEPLSFFLGLLAAIQILLVAVLALVFAGLSALIAWLVPARVPLTQKIQAVGK